jgi:hypothetical protein
VTGHHGSLRDPAVCDRQPRADLDGFGTLGWAQQVEEVGSVPVDNRILQWAILHVQESHV